MNAPARRRTQRRFVNGDDDRSQEAWSRALHSSTSHSSRRMTSWSVSKSSWRASWIKAQSDSPSQASQ